MNSIDIFPWDNNFNTCITEIDDQHRVLVKLLNVLASHIAFKSDLPELNIIFDELADYAVYHFKTEEAIWHKYLSNDYTEVAHKEIHQNFIDEVVKLKNSQNDSSMEQVAEDVLSFLTRWLASHILESDRYLSYIVLAMRGGLNLEAAKFSANEQMSGATKVLIEIILSIYESLSANTLQLMRELAERKRNEKALVQAKLEAEAANLAKSQFLSTISHEIRTPLNGILGMAQLLQMPDVNENERMDYAATIINSGQTLLSLLNDVLDISKLETLKIQLDSVSFRPSLMVNELKNIYAPVASQKGVALKMDWMGNSDQQYLSDPYRLRQMLTHLFNNAIKFSENGEIKIEIREIERKNRSAWLEFTVLDTGVGIAEDKISLLFRPFSQLDSSITRKFGGTGLGLSIVNGFAKLMDGSVGVESEFQKGSKFWFRVKVKLDE
jgi:hemerythrin-like metal-binding protein